MKEITLFTLKNCPHCLLAKSCLARLRAQDARYAAVAVQEFDEREHKQLADSYDYWYVPAFFIGDRKLHEGHAEYEDVKRVLDAALEESATSSAAAGY